MAKKNPEKARLKELGFSEYMLSEFRKQQREFEQYASQAREFNKKVLGSETATRSYDYSQLLRYVENTGAVGRTALQGLHEEQQEQITAIENYGFSAEFVDLVNEVIKLYNTYTPYGEAELDRTLEHIKETYGGNEADLVDEFMYFTDWVYKYQESLDGGYFGETGNDLFMTIGGYLGAI